MNKNTTAAQLLDLDKLEALAKAARDDIIRSHGWAGTVDGFDALRTDEQYLLAANPATIITLTALARAALTQQAEAPQSGAADTTASASIDTPEFRALLAKTVHGAPFHLPSLENLVAHIDSRAARAVQAGEAVDKLRERVLETWANYERMGEVCSFEGNQMIYASTLEELVELARATPVAAQQAAALECGDCNDTGIVGFPPDRYEDCQKCTEAAAKAPAAQAVTATDLAKRLREKVVRGTHPNFKADVLAAADLIDVAQSVSAAQVVAWANPRDIESDTHIDCWAYKTANYTMPLYAQPATIKGFELVDCGTCGCQVSLPVEYGIAASPASTPEASQQAATVTAPVQPVELMGVAEEIAEGSGFWRECSGCYDTEDGRPTQDYAYSHVFSCALGNGCSECGGIGAVWDNTDYEEMARGWDEDAAPAAQQAAPTVCLACSGDNCPTCKTNRAAPATAGMVEDAKDAALQQCGWMYIDDDGYGPFHCESERNAKRYLHHWAVFKRAPADGHVCDYKLAYGQCSQCATLAAQQDQASAKDEGGAA